MKIKKAKKNVKKDEDLFGLLSSYKADITYIKVFVSDEEKKISVILTNNPGNWKNVDTKNYENFYELKRLEIGNPKLSVKYIRPMHLIKIWGEQLNFKIPENKVKVINRIDDGGFFILETSSRYKKKILLGINKILNLNPQKKYEIIEKFFAGTQE